jgi:transcriptional regulator with XRE-family HTH domain
VRLRLPELLEARGLTGYEIAKRSRGRISPSAIYSLLRQRGAFQRISGDHLDALCDVLGVDPSELLERDRVARKRGR